MLDNKPLVSVYITVFNHAKYLRKAIDSVLMQKTNFDYEILIGDDVSSDGSQDIIREYKDKHPEQIRIFLCDKNLYSSKINLLEKLRRECKGKYMICLEGDDFWFDENKLQKQVDFLESNPDYIAIAHATQVVDKNSEPLDETYPECEEGDYSLKYLASEIMPGQLTTLLQKNHYLDSTYDESCFEEQLITRDRLIYFYLASHGKIRCSNEKMSAYRHIKDEGDSFSATHKYDFEHNKRLYSSMIKAADDANNSSAKEIAEMLYYQNLMQGLKQKQCTKDEVKKGRQLLSDGKRARRNYLKMWLNHHILHKKVWI